MQLIKTIFMSDIRESKEYRIVKTLTSKDNKEALKRALLESLIFFGMIGVWLYALVKMTVFIWRW